MARLQRRPSSRAGLVSVVLVLALLAASSTVTAAAAATQEERHRSRRLLVTAPRVSPAGAQQQQEVQMNVGDWRAETPFRGARASLGRRIPGSHANPSHN